MMGIVKAAMQAQQLREAKKTREALSPPETPPEGVAWAIAHVEYCIAVDKTPDRMALMWLLWAAKR